MIIPFPERIPPFYAGVFALMLTILLVASGTGILFSLLAGIFVMLSTFAFNIAGGLTRPSGSYVFFFAILAVILGLVVKVALWEPADLMLKVPVTMMGAYTGSMLSMLFAAYMSRKLSARKGLLQDLASLEDLRLSAIGCVVAGILIPFLGAVGAATNSPLLLPLVTASMQLNRSLPMAIILGVTYEVISSNGKRSISPWVLAGTGLIFFRGVLLGYSKEALFTPPLCWIASAAALRYRFTFYQIIGGFLTLMFISIYMVPYCQIGRGVVSGDPNMSFNQQVTTSLTLLSELPEVREDYAKRREQEQGNDSTAGTVFFRDNVGLFERLQMISVDDALAYVTETNGPYGLAPYLAYALQVIPRVFWKEKPTVIMGNLFAHEIGFPEEDTTTGISFSPVGEVFHEARWFGVFFVAPIVWFLLFFVMDSLCGDVRKSPWGILVLALFAHIAPEGLMQGAIYIMTYGALIVVSVAFFSAYVMPLLANLITPPKRHMAPPSVAGMGRASFPVAAPAPIRR